MFSIVASLLVLALAAASAPLHAQRLDRFLALTAGVGGFRPLTPAAGSVMLEPAAAFVLGLDAPFPSQRLRTRVRWTSVPRVHLPERYGVSERGEANSLRVIALDVLWSLPVRTERVQPYLGVGGGVKQYTFREAIVSGDVIGPFGDERARATVGVAVGARVRLLGTSAELEVSDQASGFRAYGDERAAVLHDLVGTLALRLPLHFQPRPTRRGGA